MARPKIDEQYFLRNSHEVLSQEDKNFIRECYGKGIQPKFIVKSLQQENKRIKDYHVYGFASIEKLSNKPHKIREGEKVPVGMFNYKENKNWLI